MTDGIKKFLEEASKNGELQDRLIKANNDYFQTVIDAARELGIDLTTKDIALILNADKNHDGVISQEELDSLNAEELQADESEKDELTAVAGGKYDYDVYYHGIKSDCGCFLGGGGSSDQYQKTCACVLAGAGELTDYGKQEAAAGRLAYAGSASAPVAMWCAVGGTGLPDNG